MGGQYDPAFALSGGLPRSGRCKRTCVEHSSTFKEENVRTKLVVAFVGFVLLSLALVACAPSEAEK
jgi:hypothetical protein